MFGDSLSEQVPSDREKVKSKGTTANLGATPRLDMRLDLLNTGVATCTLEARKLPCDENQQKSFDLHVPSFGSPL